MSAITRVGEDPVVPAPTGADAVDPRARPLRRAAARAAAAAGARPAAAGGPRHARARRGDPVAEGADVVLGDGVHLGSGCRLEALDGTLRLGARTLVGPRAFVVSLAGMEVGADCTIGDFAGVGVPAAPGRSGP